jgi:hypothetical protein
MNIAGALCLSDLGRPIIATYSTIDSESIVDFIYPINLKMRSLSFGSCH